MSQRKNLIDLGHDLGNLDQDLMHPDQDSRFLAMMSKILPKKILNNFKIGLKIIHSNSKLRDCVKTDYQNQTTYSERIILSKIMVRILVCNLDQDSTQEY